MPAHQVRIKRVYEPPSPDDGRRVLVDRLWPRGLSKERARLDLWLRDVAPSTELRRSYGHDPARWDEFVERYTAELESPERKAALERLAQLAQEGPLTLLYAARDAAHNQALLLAEILNRE
jgi:uncharacterized protein YeaO (DUF488 family)